MARPTKYTRETVEEILKALRAGATITAALGANGVTDDTFANWRRRYSGFSDAVTRAQAGGRLWHELNLRKAADGDWRASLEYLARRYPADWRKRDETALTGPDGGPIQLDTLSDAARAERIAILLERAARRLPAPDAA